MKHLYRSRDDKIFAGVCGGIGEYFDIDPVLFRLALFLLMLLSLPMSFVGLIIFYFIAWLIVPEKPLSAQAIAAEGSKKGSN
jgi:phage shock protein C